MGIEPTGDGTRLPEGFEDLGKHQLHNQPHLFYGALRYSTITLRELQLFKMRAGLVLFDWRVAGIVRWNSRKAPDERGRDQHGKTNAHSRNGRAY